MNNKTVIKYLAMGLPPGKIASIVGLSPGRISQIAAENKEEISLLSIEQTPEDLREGKVEAAKNVLLDHIIAEAGTGQYTLIELTRAYEMLSRAQNTQQKNIIPLPDTMIAGNITNISLPMFVIPNISLSQEKEVIAVEDRALTPLPSMQVKNLFEELRHEPRRISPVTTESVE